MNNPFDSSGQWGLPGTSVMRGMTAANQANQSYRQMMMTFMKEQQERKNQELYDTQRQIQMSEAQTALPLTQKKNENLLKLNNLGNINTQEDWLRAKQAFNPGVQYSLGKDSKGNAVTYIVGPDGKLTTPEPVHTGASATKYFAEKHGRNLFTLPEQLPQENLAEGQLFSQLQGRNDRQYAALQKQLMGLQMGMHRGMGGLGGGGRGGRGGVGGQGGGDNPFGTMKFSDFYTHVVPNARQYVYNQHGIGTDRTTGLPARYDATTQTMVPLSPQEIKEFDDLVMQRASDFAKDFAVNRDPAAADFAATRANTQRTHRAYQQGEALNQDLTNMGYVQGPNGALVNTTPIGQNISAPYTPTAFPGSTIPGGNTQLVAPGVSPIAQATPVARQGIPSQASAGTARALGRVPTSGPMSVTITPQQRALMEEEARLLKERAAQIFFAPISTNIPAYNNGIPNLYR